MSEWKPAGYPAISPYMIVDNPEAVIAFAEALFGGQRLRIVRDDEGHIRHGEVRIGDAVLMLGGAMAGWPAQPGHLHFYMPDVDAVWARALDLGATPVQEPRQGDDPDYRGGFTGPGGITWWIASQTTDKEPN